MFEFGFTKKDAGRVAYAALFAFVGGFILAIQGLGPVKDLDGAKAVVVAGIVGGIAAVGSFIKNLFLAPAPAAKGP